MDFEEAIMRAKEFLIKIGGYHAPALDAVKEIYRTEWQDISSPGYTLVVDIEKKAGEVIAFSKKEIQKEGNNG